jgi:hypothetical protein
MVGTIRPSLRNGLTAYTALSLGEPGFLAPIACAKPGFAQAWHQRRGARTTRLDASSKDTRPTRYRSATALVKAGQRRPSCDTAASIASRAPRP